MRIAHLSCVSLRSVYQDCLHEQERGKRTEGRIGKKMTMHIINRLVALLVLLAFCGTASQALAQTAQASNTTAGAINGTTTCAAPLRRTFSVTSNFIIGDVDIGVLATHTWRGDMRMTLISPQGTRVQVVTGDTSDPRGDNFNVRLNDGATTVVNTDGATRDHTTTAPPYQNNFRPNNPLSTFNGQNSAGTWTLEICDLFPAQDNGNFVRADLYLTGQLVDLSLAKTVSNAAPANGTSITYTLSVTNAASSQTAASGVVVRDQLPTGVTFLSASGTGTYSSATGLWQVGSIPIGATRSIVLTGRVAASAGSTVRNVAEVSSSANIDPDSTPGNTVETEDDFAAASFTVQGTRVAGVPPTLFCPRGSSVFDWDARPWAAGTLSNTYGVTNIGTVGFNVSSPGVFVNDPAFGGQSPALSTANNGGSTASGLSLHLYLDFANRSQTATTTISLPTAIPGAQFTIFDIDFAADDFADKLTVTGYFGTSQVLPTLTNGVANYVVGNTAIGDAGSAGTSGDGNVVVTFSQPVDRIEVVYGNANTAPAAPDGQAIAIHDLTFCNPQAVVSVDKISTVISDPTNGTQNPKAIPGAIMRYCILIGNAGSGTATNLVATDLLPSSITYRTGSLASGPACATATTQEDDNATGPDETDPFGASIDASTVTARATSLAPDQSFAIIFEAAIN